MQQTNANEIVVLYCGRAVQPETRLPEISLLPDGQRLRHVMLACGSKVETLDLLKLVEDGAAGVLVVCCPFEECQFINGSRHAAGRVSHARQLLAEIGLSPDRIKFVPRYGLDAANATRLIEAYLETLKQPSGATA